MPRRQASVPASPRLLIRSSDIHAAGCITLDPIKRGHKILEYHGERIAKDVADLRYENRVVTYLFGFGKDGDVIDGFGTAMFLNHSCNPNCQTEEIDGRVFVRALRDIAAGEELVYEYNLYDSDVDDNADCYCGAKPCRGTMYSDDEVKRRNKALAKRAAKAQKLDEHTVIG
ncbi:MAG: SET domain-containing protein-lysine N-methyltransferase [Acidobacteriaceae bacterium]|nr:SET domain-containing protein-lysine N-methyltransferase [Acidobacteriaceae bacterium]